MTLNSAFNNWYEELLNRTYKDILQEEGDVQKADERMWEVLLKMHASA